MRLTLALVFGANFFLASPASSAEKPISWLAFGDLRSNLEPCGCDPDSDLGGVKRLSNMLEKELAIDPKVQVFSLGENLLTDKGYTSKNSYILKSFEKMPISAYLPGTGELANLSQLKALVKGKFVLTNQGKNLESSKINRVIQVGAVSVFGYLYTDELGNKGTTIKDIASFLSFIKSKDQPPSTRILLFRGPQSILAKIHATNLFSDIIVGNNRNLNEIIDQAEKNNPDRLEVTLPPAAILSSKEQVKAKKIYMVPLGTQGVLRGGLAEGRAAPSLAELLGKKVEDNPLVSCPGGALTCAGNQTRGFVTWLEKSRYEYASKLDVILGEYKNQETDRFKTLATSRSKDLASSPFAGAEVCKNCHEGEFKKWSQSKHAHAYQSLKTDAAATTPECVECHSVGYKEKGGFASEEFSPHLANVQCENCHGPRKSHSQNPSVKPESQPKSLADFEQAVCLNCHVGMHSPKFEFKAYWNTISHGKETFQK